MDATLYYYTIYNMYILYYYTRDQCQNHYHLCYSLHINDLPDNIIIKSKIGLFADDLKLIGNASQHEP